MSSNFRYGAVIVFALFCMTASLWAKVERTTVYMFGFAASFTDSVAYVTDIQQLDSAYMETKSEFLVDRVVYSDQMQTYLETSALMPNCTCTVFFGTKKNKVEEEYRKIRKRYQEDGSVILKDLKSASFKFLSPQYVSSTDGTVQQPSSKQDFPEKKRRKADKRK